MVSKLQEIRSWLFIPDPDPDFLPIPDPGVKKAPDPGSGSAKCLRMCKILVTFPHLCSHSTIGRTIQRGAGEPTLAATSGPDSIHGREPEESHSISTGFPRSQYTYLVYFLFSKSVMLAPVLRIRIRSWILCLWASQIQIR
jgi:hypothetical protein